MRQPGQPALAIVTASAAPDGIIFPATASLALLSRLPGGRRPGGNAYRLQPGRQYRTCLVIYSVETSRP
jgi:hypothetical protein